MNENYEKILLKSNTKAQLSDFNEDKVTKRLYIFSIKRENEKEDFKVEKFFFIDHKKGSTKRENGWGCQRGISFSL